MDINKQISKMEISNKQSDNPLHYVPEKTVLAIEKHVEASKKKRSAETEPKAE